MGFTEPIKHELKDKVKLDNSLEKKPDTTDKNIILDFIKKYGLTQEHLDGIELESKLNFKNESDLINSFNKIELNPPYIQNDFISNNRGKHFCYGYLSKDFLPEYAFIKMDFDKSSIIKSKKDFVIEKIKDIYLVKRQEILKKLTDFEIQHFIEKAAINSRKNSKFLVYLGYFDKITYEKFIANLNTGRVFCMGANICSTLGKKDKLLQLEFEYKGQLKTFNSKKSAEEDLADITNCFLDNVSRSSATSSALTKFEWMLM